MPVRSNPELDREIKVVDVIGRDCAHGVVLSVIEMFQH
jgi:hypothetical protein